MLTVLSKSVIPVSELQENCVIPARHWRGSTVTIIILCLITFLVSSSFSTDLAIMLPKSIKVDSPQVLVKALS
jgi:hypothetical protein